MDNTIQSHDKSTGNNKHQVISKVREAINDHHNDKKNEEYLNPQESHHKGNHYSGGLTRDPHFEKHLKSMQGLTDGLNNDEPITRKRSSLSPRHTCKDEFSEFIKMNKNENKYNHQMEQKLDVTDINHIVFEESDGTEINFSDLFEYRASIGAGGFGFVVAALDKQTGEEIAIKILNKLDVLDIVIELFK